MKLISPSHRQRGQTTIEYMLLLVVVIGLAVTFMTRVKSFVIGESENCTPNSIALICQFERAYDFGNLRYYPLRL